MADRKNVSNQGGERSAGEWWRAPDDQQVGRDGQGKEVEYKGGRQETGGIPNPDDRDDSGTTGRSKDVNSQTRNPI